MADDHPELAGASPGENDLETAPSEADEQESPELRAARGAVRRAQEELHRARQAYEEIHKEAAQGLKRVRERTVGELVEGGLEFVRKHPGPGVVIAAVLGFFLGRLFRR